MLSTSLGDLTNHYQFTTKDKLRQDAAPPAAIKIEKLPKHGKILITQNDGSTKELAVGDIVSTKLMSNFRYDQGENGCSIENQNTKCSDEFLYSTFSSWVGIGQETTAKIRLTPVSNARTPLQEAIVSPSEIAVAPLSPDFAQTKEEENEVKAPVGAETAKKCKERNPMFLNVMIGILFMMILVLVSVTGYCIHVKKAMEKKRVAREANKDFDAVVENQQ